MNRSASTISFFSPAEVTDITIEFSAPRKNHRKIFGNVVPFGRPWRTGANGNSTIRISQDLEFSEGTLPAGDYALYTVPTKERWTVIFYASTQNWGLPQVWDDREVALSLECSPRVLDHVIESLSIAVQQKSHFEGSIEIAWDTTAVSVPFVMPKQRNALVGSELVVGGASVNDFYSSAKFYYDHDVDTHGALLRINVAIKNNKHPPYFYYRLKSLIEAKLGDWREALRSAEKSLELSRAAGSRSYELLNISSIAALREKATSDVAPKEMA